MQLKIQRSQRVGGVLGNTALFCLDVRAAYSEQETLNISRYSLGRQVIYNSAAAKRHLANYDANVGRMNSYDLKSQAAGFAKGMASLAMAKLSLNISIASLGRGHHIECKDLEELLEAEDTIRTACKNVTRYLDVAATFDGRQVLVEYDRGEEREHVSQNTLPILEYQPSAPVEGPPLLEALPTSAHGQALEPSSISSRWLIIEEKLLTHAQTWGWDATPLQIRWACAAAALLLLFLLFQL